MGGLRVTLAHYTEWGNERMNEWRKDLYTELNFVGEKTHHLWRYAQNQVQYVHKNLVHSNTVNAHTLPYTDSLRTSWKWKLNIIFSYFGHRCTEAVLHSSCHIHRWWREGRHWAGGVSWSWKQEDVREKHEEPRETGVSTTWPHPIVGSLVIVSFCLMSLADSGHVSGKKEGAGDWKLGRMYEWFAREMKWT